MQSSKLKARLLQLLKEDVEFRYAVAGLLGLEEILKRLDKHEAELVKLREDMNKLRQDMMLGFKRHDEELTRLRQDMMLGFDLLKRHIDALERRLDSMERRLDALGARWGLLSEKAFREGLRGVVERALGLKVEKWVKRDEEGYVYGHPSEVDVDVALHDDKVVLVEIKSHVSKSDIFFFKRKAEFYERVEKRKPNRLVVVTPYADEDALKMAEQLKVEVYTAA